MKEYTEIIESFYDNYKAQIDLESKTEKVIDDYLEKIDKIEKGIRLPTVVAITSFLIYFIVLAVFISIKNPPNYLYTLIPSLVGMVSLTIVMNLYIKLINTYSDAKDYIEAGSNTEVNIASMISYFAINMTAVGVVCYLVSITMKAEQLLPVQMNILNIPIYIVCGFGVFYFLFFLPALIKDKAIWSIVIFSLLLIGVFSFILFISMIIDKTEAYNYTMAFSSLWIPLLILQIWTCTQFCNSNGQQVIFDKISKVILVFTLLTFSVLLPLKLDGFIDTFYWVLMLLPISGYSIFYSEKLRSMFTIEEQQANEFTKENQI